MAHEPEFMEKFQAFEADRDAVASLDDWVAFKKRWFDTDQWPQKTSSQIASDSARKRGPVELGGRSWSYTGSIYDVTPEARYEHAKAFSVVGDPLLFPAPPIDERSATKGWALECPHCELITNDLSFDDLTNAACPVCRRPLLWTRSDG